MSVRDRWRALVECIADLLGPCAEVVLHDVRHPDRSIVLIRNGHVTGRKVGAPLTDIGFLMLRDAARGKDALGVYDNTTESGKHLKCNALVLRDDNGAVAAMLCINLEVPSVEAVGSNELFSPEHYHTGVSQVIGSLIEKASMSFGIAGKDLSSEEKRKIIAALSDDGVFMARGAVKQVSLRLGIAAPTVYKYIQGARKARS
jgi:predicted transcriptional regulator YheO